MKTIFEIGGSGGKGGARRQRGRLALGARAPLEDRRDYDGGQRGDHGEGRVLLAAPPRALPGLLDQRLDEGLGLLAADGIARAGWAGRCAESHSCLLGTFVLL